MDEFTIPQTFSMAIDKELITTTTATVQKLLELGSDAFTLYFFYSLLSRENIERIVSLDGTSCANALKWDRHRFFKAKTSLIDSGLIEKNIKKNNGLIQKHEIKVMYIDTLKSSVRVFHTVDNPHSGDLMQNDIEESSVRKNHTVEEPHNGSHSNIYINNTRDSYMHKTSDGLISKTVNQLTDKLDNRKIDRPFNSSKYIIMSSKKNKNPEDKDLGNNIEDKERFSTQQSSLLKSEEIETPCKRTKKCGHCAECSLAPCTEKMLWELSNKLDISLESVENKHKTILEMIESGEFQKKYKSHKTVYNTLLKWLRMDLQRGVIQTRSPEEKMIQQSRSPEQLERFRLLFKKAKEQGVL